MSGGYITSNRMQNNKIPKHVKYVQEIYNIGAEKRLSPLIRLCVRCICIDCIWPMNFYRLYMANVHREIFYLSVNNISELNISLNTHFC